MLGLYWVILSSVCFWWLNLVRVFSLYKILFPKGGKDVTLYWIECYSILGTIVSPNQILLRWWDRVRQGG